MKYCSKCGKEISDEEVICPACGCSAENKGTVSKVSYEAVVSISSMTNIFSILILVVGIVVALFVHAWAGIVLCFAAEFVALLPNNRLQSAFKKNNGKRDKNSEKAVKNELKAKNTAYKFSSIVGYISFACMIIFIVWVSVLENMM